MKDLSWTHELEEEPRSSEGLSEADSTSSGSWQLDITHPAVADFAKNSTPQSRLSEKQRQAEKMQVLGQLAGGVAHDFNNQLAGIIGFAELLKSDLEGSGKHHRYTESILRSAHRAKDLANQLLAFSRKGPSNSSSVAVHDLLREVVTLLERSIDRRISIGLRLEAGSAVVTGDSSQLQNAFLNMAINARDAMPDGGELSITTRRETLCAGDPLLSEEDMEPGEYVLVGFGDTGTGIDPEILDRIFEPFFTTKPRGKGTGMGLAAVYGTIRNHGGIVEVRSRPGEGTTFTVLLPAGLDAPATRWPTLEPVAAAREARLLIIDDEQQVLMAETEILRRLGYRPFICDDPWEAVRAFESTHDDIDLVLLDMMMLNAGGLEVFRALKQIDPDVKVLLVSGSSRGGEVRTAIAEGALGYLGKPFTSVELSRRVEESLRGKAGPLSEES